MLKRLGKRLFTFYCHPDFQEDIKGDLEEYYAWNFEERGERYANRKYLVDVLLLFRISLLRETWISRNTTKLAMVKNNLKVAYRSMMRHKFYTFLNLGGLAVSIAASILIALYVHDELSYDSHHEESDKVFRIATHLKFGDNEFKLPAAPAPMAATLKQDFPEVIESARVRGQNEGLIAYGDNYFQQRLISYADQGIFKILKFEIIKGDPDHLLDEPNTVVIDESTALKIFGDEEPVGKVIRFNEQTELKVTGVYKDLPENTHLQREMLITMINHPNAKSQNWLSNNFLTYLRLNAPEDAGRLEAKFPDFVKKYFAAQLKQFAGMEYEEVMNAGTIMDYRFQPVERIHLYSNADYGIPSAGSIQYVYTFSVIGFFIVLIACINFMNLATARASVRAKEVGVRKVLGSLRKQLINQFLTEAVLNSTIAFALAIAIVHLVLPSFNQLIDRSFVNPVFGENGLWPYLLVACLLVGLTSGLYPAFVLSSFRPVKVLKGEVSKGRGASMMRNVLVVVQFTTSIILIIGSLVVYNQLNYLQTKDLGFNKDQVLIVNDTDLLGENIEAFKNELLRNPAVVQTSVTSYVPASNISSDYPMVREDATSAEAAVSMQYWRVDEAYAETFDLNIIKGRFFSEDFETDKTAIVVNETALERFGYSEDPIGKKLKMLGGIGGAPTVTFTIIGVMKDFHFKNMTEVIAPHALMLSEDKSALNIKFSADRAFEVLESTERLWNEMSGGKPFEYDFMDQLFKNQFASENRVKTLSTIFAALAIIIACLGLFGLAAYVTEQRKKEIGIRKVLGASVFKLLALFFKSFNMLVVISAVLAIPTAFFFMKGWLSDFSYRISLSPMIFIIGAVGTLLIAWLTVAYQSLKAARRNPIDNLRYE